MQKNNTKKIGVFAGSFDPVTLGHIDIVARASKMFYELFVVVANNPSKACKYDLEHRLAMLSSSIAHIPNIVVEYCEGLLVDFCKAKNITTIVRGIRNIIDFEYEKSLFEFNYSISNNTIDTIFLPCKNSLSHINSTAIRELLSYNKSVNEYVPKQIIDML